MPRRPKPVLGPSRLSQVLAHSDRLVEASELLGREAGRTTDARSRLRMQAEKFMWDAFRADEPESPARSRRLAALADRLARAPVAARGPGSGGHAGR